MHYFSGIFNREASPKKMNSLYPVADWMGAPPLIKDNGFVAGITLPDKKTGLQSLPEFSRSQEDNTVVLFEGRLNNKQELMDGLPDVFGSSALSCSDLVRILYSTHGLEALSKLKGIFAFVVRDKSKNQLFLCRDAIGTKPLYYIFAQNDLIFATMMQPILAHPLVKKEINLRWIFHYFVLNGLNFGAETEYQGIKSVMPGECVIVGPEGIESRRLFSLGCYDLKHRDEQQICTLFGRVIENGIRRCVLGRQKAAIAFSGGVDTNTILSVCAKEKGFPIDTYTLKFESRSQVKTLDYQMARQRAWQFCTRHHEEALGPRRFLEEIGKIGPTINRLVSLEHMNNFFILKWIAETDRCVLTGDGTEEQLGSYRYTWPAYYADQYLRRAPDVNFFILNRFFHNILFQRTGWHEGTEKAKELFTLSAQALLKDYDAPEIRDACIEKSVYTNLVEEKGGYIPSVLDKFLWIDFFYFFCPSKFLVSDLVSRVFSLDVCMPFVDQDFVAFSFSVPVQWKCRGFAKRKTKYIFRAAVADLVGKENAFREFKSGSDIPYNEWLLDKEFEKYIRDTLSPSRIKKSGIINDMYVQRMLKAHYKNRQLFASPYTHVLHKKGADYRTDILKLLAFQVWWENNFS